MKKTAIIILFLFMIGVLIWLISKPDSAPQKMPEMIRFNPADVFSLILAHEGAETIFLRRSGDQWKLLKECSEDKKMAFAQAAAVQHLLDDLANMDVVRVVTRNPEYYEKLHVGSGSTQVLLKDKGDSVITNLFVGKQGRDLISTYLRVDGMPEVLAVNKVLLWQVRRSYQGWKAVDSAKTEGNTGNTVEVYSQAQ